jgi:starvation-inducible DNA-binding protein
LQTTLVELIDLSLIGKQLHWNINGRPFKPLHEHLDELVDTWRQLSDTVAEGVVALGIAPDGQAGRVNANSRIEPVDRGTRHRHRHARARQAPGRRHRANRGSHGPPWRT